MITIAEIKTAAKTARAVFIATDPDREGEAIAYHVAEQIKPKRGKKKAEDGDTAQAGVFIPFAGRQPPWYWLTRADDPSMIARYQTVVDAAAAYPVVARCSLDPAYSLVRLAKP